MASHDYYSEDHLNKPLPPPLSASPAPMDGPHRQDTVGSYASSQYSQRGNTIPAHQAYPARSDTYASAVPSLPSIPPQHRQDTYSSSVYTAPAPYGAPAASSAPAPSLYSNAPSYSNPPSYTTQQHLGTQPPGQNPSPVSAKSVSPFDTVFDDHAYPATSYQSATSSRQHLTGQDTSYHGGNGSPSDDRGHPQDAIPLQDRGAKDPNDDLDHVYEAPQRRRTERKQGVRFGELGMFGAYGNRIPWVVYIFTVVQVGVFIGEVAKNVIETGSPIMIKPSFNPMIGPSTYVMINFGARFVPCMHNVDGITNANESISWPCPNTTSSDTSTYICTLSDLCGFGGIPEPKYSLDASMSDKPEPNQWWRFILPMFMHAGLIHIAFNLLLQLTMGKEMERSIGSLRFFLVYVSSGIFGFVLGGNYAGAGLASTGASGSLFGVIALTLLDLFYSWSDRLTPVRDLMFIMLDIIISFVLGLLPGVDNFSHIGGLLMGLALGLSVLHSPNALRRRIGDDSPYSTVNSGYTGDKPPGFLKNPVGFFKGRKPFWWAWWLVRAGALLLVFVVFIVLLQNFYVYRKTCSWCKYLSCLPVSNWCNSGLTFT
ncbi:putative rhomboid family membrane protein [Diaporthe ampelina]|uniref:Rhomboid-type serine protease n=1 Tax=Diaporthe ampelina TaxID=1214573 RepID=A0A0G2F7C1_9PEZI|nr:putative rhomboid family membrane protein [Diaporthe ampelina]